ncbi:TetR/AcrR family transcriptional regulator [Rhodococcus sp. ARC_M6]|uniref:TetR/AcrR family transcriptional regulator n=1 Tax=Rhodococcus sp. ARC_M6 TaxID=2928852 RepID=UPI001FB23496|nr:TetR/AcrR family transcriptional regulator [Rhodococcus sp. ARC_M6]MCJ0905687.1 TetR/AcrR family transcriptional regulator [Rhodococcus sp. ARC_M6]
MDERKDRRIGTAGVGRPRDPQVDLAILAATRELLAEDGYQKTTITAIARRANLGTAAIYRRWATRESIIEDAVFSMQDAALPVTTSNLRDDLVTWTRWFLTQVAEPATRAAIPGLLSAYHVEDGAYENLVHRSEDPARFAMVERVRAEFPERSDADIVAAADVAFDFLVAATIMRGLTSGLADADAFCSRTAGSLLLLITETRAALQGN